MKKKIVVWSCFIIIIVTFLGFGFLFHNKRINAEKKSQTMLFELEILENILKDGTKEFTFQEDTIYNMKLRIADLKFQFSLLNNEKEILLDKISKLQEEISIIEGK